MNSESADTSEEVKGGTDSKSSWRDILIFSVVLTGIAFGVDQYLGGRIDDSGPTTASTSQVPSAATAVRPNGGSTAQSLEQASLLGRCLSAALDEGYRDGQCAYPFVKACVTTQSKQEMAMAKASFPYARGCPNMPLTYSSAFEAVFSGRDRF